MASNPLDKVHLTEAQLATIAGGGSVVSGSDTYTADESTLYLTPDTSISYEAQTLTAEQQAQARQNIGAGSASATSVLVNGVLESTINFDSDPQTQISGKQNTIDSSHKLSADLVEDGTTNKVFTATEQSKLSGIASGAEVNDVTDIKVDNVSVVSSKIGNLSTINSDYNASTNKLATNNDLSGFISATTVSTTPDVVDALLDIIYPVGSIRFSINSTEENFMGGTWVKVAQGRAIFGAGQINADGSAGTDLTYVADQPVNAGLPSHTHSYSFRYRDPGYTGGGYNGVGSGSSWFGYHSENSTTGQASNSLYGNSTTVQPNAYVLYIYKRTA